MTYAKLLNNTLVLAPNPIIIGDRQIGNPPGEVYTAEGYKPVRFTDQPTEPTEGYKPVIYTDMPIAPEGYYYEEKWTESENSITQSWELIEIPSETDVDPYEAMQILFGE